MGLVIASIAIATQTVGSGNGDASLLRDVDHHRAAQMISSILQAIGVGLLACPLLYLFRAALGRSPSMRGGLIGLVIAAPLFLAVADVLAGISFLHSATDFVAKNVTGTGSHANQIAQDAISGAPLQGLGIGFELAGKLGFAIAMFYTSLHAMRTGLLSRFWGSLGMALGAVSFIFFQFAVLWFVYLALLILGRTSGGRPPAWATGEAIPWPSPGEKAAADLSPTPSDPEEPADPALPPGEPRKRKQRP
ncbi:MAG TPA: hypothetical protein VNY83_05715 [Solirubrobacterales bacterium]|nr:hypothetical protein [Solirubrobacterales bacterium]